MFLLATLLTIPEIGAFIVPDALLAGQGDRLNILSAPMLLIFYPLHAFVTVKITNRLAANTTLLASRLIHTLAYLSAAVAAGFLWAVIMLIGAALFLAFR